MKTLLIPGWMKSVDYYGGFEGLDVWKKGFTLNDNRSIECVVAHSMGATYALAEEQVGNENTKYFLINPVIGRISFFSWIWRWIKFAFGGGIRSDRTMGMRDIFTAFRRALEVSRHDIDKTISKMLKDNIVIIRGKLDNYFCDEKSVETAKQYGLKVVEVDGLGHEWDEKYKDVLNSFLF